MKLFSVIKIYAEHFRSRNQSGQYETTSQKLRLNAGRQNDNNIFFVFCYLQSWNSTDVLWLMLSLLSVYTMYVIGLIVLEIFLFLSVIVCVHCPGNGTAWLSS